MRIVITGEGIISSIGCNKGEVLHSLQEKRGGIGDVRFLPTAHRNLPVGEVPLSNDELKAKLGIDPGREVSRTTLMAVHAIREALDDINITDTDLQGRRVALVSGTTVGGMDVVERHFLEGDTQGVARFFREHDCGGSTCSIAGYFPYISDLVTISTACSSAANAVIVGSEMLRNDEADIVISGGTEALSLFHLNGFNSLMILDHRVCRPFDATRAGLNLGEGAAYIILEKEADAVRRGQKQYAYVRGYGNACDAFHQTASSPDGEGPFRAMSLAMDMATLSAVEIDYVNAHGTGTQNNDETELAALQRIFGRDMPPVSSTKGFTGHTTSASGSIELVICLLAMEHHLIPANLNWSEAMPGFIPSPGKDNTRVDTVMCNSFGFGGNDSSIIVSTFPGGQFPDQRPFTDDDIVIAASSELCDEEELTAIREFVSPMEARRMGRLLKASLITSLRVLRDSGTGVPDAIVTGTAHGCLENSDMILLSLCREGEGAVSPTLFMQSTHNTISSNIAMRTKCHGYNITYSQGDDSLSLAMRDAGRLLRSGKYKTVLVGIHDESTPLFCELAAQAGETVPKSIYSKSFLLTCRK